MGDPSRCRDAPRRRRDASGTQKREPGTSQERSWDRPGTSKSAPGTLWASPECPWGVSGRLRSAVSDASLQRSGFQMPAHRLFVDIAAARDGPHVRFDPIFCDVLCMSGVVRRAQLSKCEMVGLARVPASKIDVRGVPGAVRASQIEVERPSSSEKPQPRRNAASRAHIF